MASKSYHTAAVVRCLLPRVHFIVGGHPGPIPQPASIDGDGPVLCVTLRSNVAQPAIAVCPHTKTSACGYVARFDVAGVLFDLGPNPPGNVLPGTGNARLSLGITDIQQATHALPARGVTTTPGCRAQ